MFNSKYYTIDIVYHLKICKCLFNHPLLRNGDMWLSLSSLRPVICQQNLYKQSECAVIEPATIYL